MASFLDILKFIFKNPRYRSILILVLYFLFFSVIILISKSNSDSRTIEEKIDPIDEFKSKQNYQFKVEIDNDEFEGYYSDDKITFIYNDVDYVYENDELEPSEFIYSEILKYIDTSYIYEIIEKQEIYSKTEYNNSTTSTTYLIDDIEISIYESTKIYEVDVKINDNLYKIIYN